MTGIKESSLRAWERPYAVLKPSRTEAGYRLYDEQAISALVAMRELVDSGWAPAEAARSVRSGGAPKPVEGASARWQGRDQPVPLAQLQRFLSAAASMDSAGIE